MDFDPTPFELGALTYPQPVALSCGRICRARTQQDRLDSILKCAEVLTRYLVAVSVNSYGAGQAASVATFQETSAFTGNLAWGHFLNLLRAMASAKGDHPVRPWLVKPIRGKGKEKGAANEGLTALLELRNRLGHNLASMTEPMAASIFATDEPHLHLQRVLSAVEPMLRLPLFLVEEQRLVSKKVMVLRLLLMGESSDPIPEEVELSDGLEHVRVLYVGVAGGAIPLYPLMVWGLSHRTANYGIFFVQSITDKGVKFITVNDDALEGGDEIRDDLRERLAGGGVSKETVCLSGGVDFLKEWNQKKFTIAMPRAQEEKEIPWDDLDGETLRWYGRKLDASTEKDVHDVIRERLLDGRDRLTDDEVRQILLLFGREQVVRRTLRREMVDLRFRTRSGGRWDERVELAANVIQSLKRAIEFFGKYVGVDGLTLDGLQAASGSADYIAMREAQVNLFAHQDYTDNRTVSQVEITEDRAVFFNAGQSLVSEQALFEGARSQSRNPLISRALRLIGFAELAGSGLRAMHDAWKKENRYPPTIESNSAANTFTLTLDWRLMPEDADEFWRRRLGVKLSSAEARALSLAAGRSGISAGEIAASQGIPTREAQNIVAKLIGQALVAERQDRIYISDHLRSLVEETRVDHQG
jgi:predicted HTH transcriptional regulator